MPLDTDTPREEETGFEVGTLEEAAPDDDCWMEVTVPEEEPGAPPFVGEDAGLGTEALEAPGLL